MTDVPGRRDAPEADADPLTANRMWGNGWQRYVFPAFWLVYLAQTADSVHKHSAGVAAVVGFVALAAFCACYLIALPMGWSGRYRAYWALYAGCVVLTAVECFFADGDALACLIYVAVLTVAPRNRWSLPGVIALAAVGTVLPALVPAWHSGVAWSTGIAVLLVSLAMFGFFKVVQANIDLSAARAEVARLAAENERSRIARDLHDLLGHSLTTITVKAGLARRLGEHGDAERAIAEIAEVESLARRTLGDVRAAVSSHHDVTLVGELATAREVLRAAGIIAELPPSVAESDPRHSELFGWIVREGITNVVRHSRALHVRITLDRSGIEIADDGGGGGGTVGNGLSGLRARVEAAGGTLTSGSGTLGGFRLRADVGTRAPDPSGSPVTAPA